MKKILKIILITAIIILCSAISYIYFTVPELPEDYDKIIDKILISEIPEFIKGDTGFINNKGVETWYESIPPKGYNKGVILLFMGISNDALGWPQQFIDKFVSSGYHVIRYDYRGTGYSDWLTNIDEQSYSLTDLAEDAKIILDSLKIEKANLLGVSLGGMVAQEFAIKYPERTGSLTSMMSSGNIFDKSLPEISAKTAFELVKSGLRYGLLLGDKNMIKHYLTTRIILRGNADYKIDINGISRQVLYNVKKRKGYNPRASKQHHEAVSLSGSRYDELKKLKMPVLIIHGTDDPFIPVEHSKKMVSIIPHARLKWYNNMGHNIPLTLIDPVCSEVIKVIRN